MSHPEFLEFLAPGVSKGQAAALARPPSRHPARADADDGRPVQRPRDDRGRPVTAWRCRRPRIASGPRRATSRRRWARRAPPRSSRRSSWPVARRRGTSAAGPVAPTGARAVAAEWPGRRSDDRPRSSLTTLPVASRRSPRCARARSSRCRPTRSTGWASRSTPSAGSDGCSPPSTVRSTRGSSSSWPTIARPMRPGSSTPAAHVLAAAFWPGGLTLVVPQRAEAGFPPELTGGAATIGLRLPGP